MLKESMRTLVSEVSILHRDKAAATRAPSTCHVSVLCKQPCSAHKLPSVLGCPVLYTVLVGAGLSWKVKIDKENLYNALQSSSESHSVHIWKNNQSKVISVPFFFLFFFFSFFFLFFSFFIILFYYFLFYFLFFLFFYFFYFYFIFILYFYFYIFYILFF